MPSADFGWPGVMMITAPTPTKTEYPIAGPLFKAGQLPSFILAQVRETLKRDYFSGHILWRPVSPLGPHPKVS